MDKVEVGAPREPGTRQGRLLLAFTMSLDGFVAGPDVRAGQAMGRGGDRLHDWLLTDTSERVVDADMAGEVVGLVVAAILGRRTFDVGLAHWGDTPYPVPGFVLTHQ